MFALFPILGITQGFIPIAGYNHGAQNYERVKESIQISIKYAALLSLIFCFILYYATPIVSLPIQSYAETPDALGICSFSYCHPVNRAAYFQRREMLRKRCC
jgi:Na+-driven multidrug efflux pump